MTRIELLRSFLDATKPGLEIGASHTPTCPKAAGFNVEILDHLDQAGLREKYRDHPIDPAIIEVVDHVWSGQSFKSLTGKPHGYAWVLASHVVEHTPDLIAFLNDCDDILTDDGVLVLAVPDKRFCFDHYRTKTSLAVVIDAHFNARKVHSPGTAAEVYLNLCSTKGNWQTDGQPIEIWGNKDLALSMMSASKRGEYVDMHAWAFTPASFRVILNDLFDLGLTKLREITFFDNSGHEFFCVFGRHGRGSGIPRTELLQKSLLEEGNQYRMVFDEQPLVSNDTDRKEFGTSVSDTNLATTSNL